MHSATKLKIISKKSKLTKGDNIKEIKFSQKSPVPLFPEVFIRPDAQDANCYFDHVDCKIVMTCKIAVGSIVNSLLLSLQYFHTHPPTLYFLLRVKIKDPAIPLCDTLNLSLQ